MGAQRRSAIAYRPCNLGLGPALQGKPSVVRPRSHKRSDILAAFREQGRRETAESSQPRLSDRSCISPVRGRSSG